MCFHSPAGTSRSSLAALYYMYTVTSSACAEFRSIIDSRTVLYCRKRFRNSSSEDLCAFEFLLWKIEGALRSYFSLFSPFTLL